MAALKYWLWLTTAPALSNRAKLLLLEHFSSPEDVYYAQPDQLCLVEGITRQQAESLSDKSLARAEKVLADCARDGQFIVTMDDAAYPARLRDMYDPPVLLYGKGSMPLFDEEAAVAVVGTRKCSPYGTRAASQLGYELARQGGLVISGLAKGIDGAAHQGALRAGGFTAAVLGGGADVIYPPENRRLYEDIAATGSKYYIVQERAFQKYFICEGLDVYLPGNPAYSSYIINDLFTKNMETWATNATFAATDYNLTNTKNEEYYSFRSAVINSIRDIVIQAVISDDPETVWNDFVNEHREEGDKLAAELTEEFLK